MKTITVRPRTAEEEYPELEKEASYIELCTLSMIHKAKKKVLKGKKGTSCPYPAQCLLEMVISKLKKSV